VQTHVATAAVFSLRKNKVAGVVFVVVIRLHGKSTIVECNAIIFDESVHGTTTHNNKTQCTLTTANANSPVLRFVLRFVSKIPSLTERSAAQQQQPTVIVNGGT
jgi:hypothetical protein